MNIFNITDSYSRLPSVDPHSAAQTLRVQSLVWSGADGLAVQ